MIKWLSNPLIWIVLVAVLLRFIHLADLPFPINGDEAAHGYDAWSIGKYGTDEYGQRFPIYFASAGDYKYPVYTYLTVPVVWIFGLNGFSTRFVSGLAGVLLVLVVYKLAIFLTKNKTIGLLSALFTAISPWSMIFSHTAALSNTALFLTTTGIYFLMIGLNKSNWKQLFWASGLFVLAIYTHQSARIFIPSFLVLLTIYLLITKPRFSQFAYSKKRLIVLVALVIFITGISTIPWESRARAEGLSVFSADSKRDDFIEQTKQQMGFGTVLPPVVTRMFFNKVSVLSWEVMGRYLSHFSPEYLFLKGDVVQLNSIPNMGLFYLIDGIFLVLGVVRLIQKPNFASAVILGIILASPTPAMLSIETPSAQRQLIGLSGWMLAMGVGGEYLYSLVRSNKRWLWISLVGFGGVYLYLFGFFLINFYKIKPVAQPWSSDQGYQEMVQTVWQEKSNYQAVWMRESPYIHFLYNEKISPEEFMKLADISPTSESQWDRVKRMGNIYFNMPIDCPKIGKVGVLYVCRGVQVPRSGKVVKVIRYGDLIPAFTLIKFEAMSFEKQGKEPLPSMLNYMVEGDTRYPLGVYSDENRFW